MAKLKNLNVRLSEDEYEAVSNAAETTGRTRSDYVRQMLRLKVSRTRKDNTAVELWKIERDLRFLVSHANQAQKNVHAARLAGTLTADHYARLEKAIEDATAAAKAGITSARGLIEQR